MHFDRERGGAGGLAGGGPLDLKEGADYGGGGCEGGLEWDGVEIEHAAGGEGEKVGVCVGGFEGGREGRADGRGDGGPALDEHNLERKAVAALERKRGESGGACRALNEPPRCDVYEKFHCRYDERQDVKCAEGAELGQERSGGLTRRRGGRGGGDFRSQVSSFSFLFRFPLAEGASLGGHA